MSAAKNTVQCARRGEGKVGSTIVVVVLIVLAAGLVWTYTNYVKAKKQIGATPPAANQAEVARREVADLLAKVRRLIVLPEGIDPMVTTIQDATTLASVQAFFVGAQNGDKLIIYPQKAIIYNAKDDILVNVGPVIYQNQPTSAGTAPTPTPSPRPVTLDVRNGSRTPAVARSWADKIRGNSGFQVLNVGVAANKDYPAAVIYNPLEKDISALERELPGVTTVAELPVGEVKTLADVVVIIGNQ